MSRDSTAPDDLNVETAPGSGVLTGAYQGVVTHTRTVSTRDMAPEGGTIGACDDFDEIAEWGEDNLPFLRRFLPFTTVFPARAGCAS